MSQIETQKIEQPFTEEQIRLMNISMENCFTIFDPHRTMPVPKLIELIDSEMRADYYITLFIGNTCELL